MSNRVEKARGAGRWALVAGGSGGIGSRICVAMARDGWNIALTWHRNEARANDVATEIRAIGAEVTLHRLDTTDERAAADLVEAAGGHSLGGVVYAAGPAVELEYASRIPPSTLREQLFADTNACYNVLQPSIARLRESSGAMLAVTTPAVRRMVKKHLLSAAPKAATEAMIRSIASEEGRNGVRANCLSIGLVEDGVWDSMFEKGYFTEETVAAARREIPMGTIGRATDVAAMGAFLMSDMASWVSGQTISVDGGYTI